MVKTINTVILYNYDSALHMDRVGVLNYKGISSKYYPLWYGWQVIEDNDHFDSRLDALVINFYADRFWRPMGLDSIADKFLCEVILTLSIVIGKKATNKKIALVLDDDDTAYDTINAFDSMDKVLFVYALLLDAIDLLQHHGVLHKVQPLLKLYNKCRYVYNV